MAQKKRTDGYRLQCAVTGKLTPSCNDCVPCDVARQIAAACEELHELAAGIDGTGTADRIETAVAKIEKAAVSMAG